jgi:ABC-type multidrug transport system fused ATPase/permease subunit
MVKTLVNMMLNGSKKMWPTLPKVLYIMQEHYILMGSVYENIIYGNQGFDISQENVEKAAKIANAHDFIMNLPQG